MTVASPSADNKSSGGAGGGLQLTHFTFEHKVFAVEGGNFSLSADKRDAVFNVPLGQTVGSVPLKALRTNFAIEPGGSDDQLLDIVESSLKFVKIIHPGESIPRELLDGTASWSVDERHRRIAQNRLALQLASWITGREIVVSDLDQLEMMVEDPAIKARIQEAFVHVAQRLGLPSEGKFEVMRKIETFAHELAYIEALRDECKKIKDIAEKLGRLWHVYKSDRTLSNELLRMSQLINAPIAETNGLMMQVDAQSGEILSLIKTFDAQVKFTRQMRNDLHVRVIDWEDMFKRWEDVAAERKPTMEALIKETYRFLAQRYLSSQVWKR